MRNTASGERGPSAAKEAIILLGTDTPIGLAVIRDLGHHGYFTIGIGRKEKALASFSRHCHHHVVRRADDAGIIAQIKELAETYRASCLLAIGESDLLMLNRHREELETVIRLLTPTPDRLEQVLDKSTCQDHARALGIRVPETRLFSSLAEAREGAAGLSYPVVLKWSNPHRIVAQLQAVGLEPVKVDYAQNAPELLDRLAPYEKAGVFPMVQEYCPGHGLGQMFIVKDGTVAMEFQHERLHEWPPEGGASSLCRSVALSEHRRARARSRALLERLCWTGVAMVEYRYDPKTGRYCFMEINGRFWGSLPLALAAGVPFAAALVALCGTEKRDFSFPQEYAAITSCYWIPEMKRLHRLLLQPKKIRDPLYKPDPIQSLFAYLLISFRPSNRWFIFQPSDPKPFFCDVASILAKLWEAGRYRLRARIGIRTGDGSDPTRT